MNFACSIQCCLASIQLKICSWWTHNLVFLTWLEPCGFSGWLRLTPALIRFTETKMVFPSMSPVSCLSQIEPEGSSEKLKLWACPKHTAPPIFLWCFCTHPGHLWLEADCPLMGWAVRGLPRNPHSKQGWDLTYLIQISILFLLLFAILKFLMATSDMRYDCILSLIFQSTPTKVRYPKWKEL